MNKKEIDKIYPLSSMQEGMLFHSLLDNNGTYFEQITIRLTGDFHVEQFEKSVQFIVDRYDIFRTIFIHQKVQKPRQVVLKQLAINVHHEDIRHLSVELAQQHIRRYAWEERKRGFSLSKDVLMRFAVFRTREDQYEIVWSYHHILMDGWCTSIVLGELFDVYRCFEQGLPVQMEKAMPYSQYIQWLKRWDQDEAQLYWNSYLSGYEQTATLPSRRPSAAGTYENAELLLSLDESSTEAFYELAKTFQVTSNCLFQALWGVLLQRYNRTDDVVFGAVVSGRPSEIAGIEKMVGLFINTVPVRVKADSSSSLASIARQLQEDSLLSERHAYLSLAEIQAGSPLQGNLLKTIVTYQNFGAASFDGTASIGNNLPFVVQNVETFEQSNYDFNLMIVPKQELVFKFMFNKAVYDAPFMHRILSHFRNLLHQVADNPSVALQELNVTGASEISDQLEQLTQTRTDYGKERTLAELFEEQVQRNARKTALVFEGRELSYGELNTMANRAAHRLRERGVRANTIVGVLSDRSPEMIVSLLAVLKAGGAYLPIDPEYPEERIRYMLTDSGAAWLVSRQHLADRVKQDISLITIEEAMADDGSLDTNPEPVNGSEDVACVIYTSGSTGKPKGTLTKHANISRVVKATNYIELTEEDKLLQLSNYAFDGSTFDIYGALLNGATLVLLEQEALLDMRKLTSVIREQGITVFFITTALFNVLADVDPSCLAGVRKVLFGGEKVSVPHVRQALKVMGASKLIHVYGPTESTVFATAYPVAAIEESAATVPIGKPISNTEAYVLDSSLRIQPRGVPGELCLSGAGLAKGYLNQPELTAEKFVDHPYAPGEKLYRTGDLVRLLEDGNIEYIGRIDQQVKIRGFRIEPGEIAARLREHPFIQDATVVALQENDQGAHFLCAYYTVQRPVSTSQLRVHLETELPDYMVPSYFCKLEQLALNANGKVDKAALPRPDFAQLSEAPYIAPRNTVEAALVGIWEEILGVRGIGVVDNFFQRGGHSLKVTMLVSRIQAELQVELLLREVFQYPTIEGLAKRIMNDSGSDKQSIPIADERKVYPASSAQKRLYIMNQFHESGTTYNLPCMTHIRGSLDFERISQALCALVERHEALRTSFYTVDDEVVQRVHQQVDLQVELIDMQAENVRSYVQQFIKPFNLQQAPLMRAEVLRLPDEEFVLMLDFHHIVSDGVSINLFMKELKAIYAGASLEQSRIQYKDYAVWQQERSNSEAMMKQEEYWLSRFDGNIPTLELPADYPRPAAKNFEGDRLSFLLERSVVEQLELLCKQQGTTMFMTLLAAYHVFLCRYTGQTDIVVGTPIAGRLQIELESMMGMFVNTLPLRINPARSTRFAEFLQDIKMNTLQAFENQAYPLEQLIAKLELERDVSRNPLFDTMFTLQNMGIEKMDIEGLSLSPYPYEMNIAKFDLLLAAIETDDGLLFEMEFATSLFSHDTVQRMSRYFTELLRNIARNPNLPISEYPLLTEPEQHTLLHAWNDTGTSYPKSRTLSQLFEAQTERSPDCPALAFEDRTLTYQELNEQANRFACLLREKGIGANTVVSLLFNRSVDMIIAILGVLKAGGAYLPIDPDYPSDRIEYMLHDSHARLLITDGSVSDEFAFAGETCVWRDLELVRFPETNLEPGCTTEDVACVMYTSGSTGRPKGILTAHYSISRVVMNTNYIAIQPEDRMLQLSNYVFDGSLFDIFGALLNGAQLRLLTKETLLDIEALSECIHREQITVFFITTALFNTLVDINADALRNVRRILFGGEKVSVRHVRQALSSIGANKLIHVYGPTESTVFATFHPINEIEETAATVPIGRPIANTGAYVLSPDRQLSPIGVPGELYLSGDGLSQGYLNNPVLTAEKFVPHPFVPGERLYRTGDRVKLLPSGDIEFMERIDHMVKIRGFRIELGEITDRLLACEAVKEAIVVTQNDDSGQPCICAYFVAAGPWSTAELREQLACSLPSYMIPDHFRPMDQLPLTPNGKVDRKKLPMPDFSEAASKAYEVPITSVEKRLSQMFGELFGLETVGRNADFFALGGHSLKASLLLSRIRTEFQMTISLSDIFRRPVIRDLAAVIEAGTDELAFVIEPADFRKEYPASYAQKRIYFVHELDKDNVAYNMPIWLRSETALDFARLQHSFQQLIDRHESLRTIFRMVEGELVQQICERVEFTIQNITIRSGESMADVNLIKPFDLGHAPLIRAVLFHETGGGQVLMIDIHHIVSDGVSVGVLLRELRALYECRELSPLALQYKDFSVWQQQYAQTEAWALSERYWLEMFQEEVPLLQLPTDYPRPLVQKFEGSRVSLRVDSHIGLNIRMLSSQWQMTPFNLYMSAYTWLVSLYSGQDDMVIGTPTTGRKHPSLDGVVGMFANVLPLRLFPGKEQSFHAFAQQVKERIISAHTHQEYALQNLLEKAQLRRDMSRNPLFDTVLTYQQRQDDEYRLGNHRMTEKDGGGNTSKFDLTLSVSESENGELFLDLEYSTALFKRSTVERMAGHFVRLLEQIVQRPELRLSEADIVTEQEREQLLRMFNDTSIAHPTESMVHQHFEQQAKRVPDRPAVVWREEMWTYRELNERANRIAHALRWRGAAPDAIVGILMERSPDMIAGMLGILKSGAAYMPIDPEYPAERIAYMLRDSGTKLVLTHRGLMERQTFDGTALDLTAEEQNEEPADNPAPLGGTDRRAYVIYTSGSTGQPKGVVVTHRSLTNLACWHNRAFEVTEADRSTKFAGFGFDASVWEVFPYLIAGASLYVIHDEIRLNVRELNAYYERNGITISFLPTQFCEQFMELDNRSLRVLLTGGDKLKTYRKRNYRLVNNYGPTENTVVATSSPVEKLEWNLPIGRPIDNVRAYIVGRTGGLQPIGVPGELCLAGDGLAQGYLNREELTAEKFIDNPFEAGGRMYRTGDLAKWLEDGNIAYMGRIDSQIKIRGYRIEPGEIAQRLLEHDAVDEAAVVAKEQAGGEKQLVAYIAARQEWSAAELRNWLAQTLPDYMIPRHMVAIERMPVTANGKINELALPEPNDMPAASYKAPATLTECKLAAIWEDVLGVQNVGIFDNFFERGGHSLKATQAVSRINEEMGISLSLREFFEAPTVHGQSRFLDAAAVNKFEQIQPLEKRELYPATSYQAYTYKVAMNNTAYNIPQMLLIKGELDVERLSNCFRQMIARHEVLRTSFEKVKGELMMRIHDGVPFALNVEPAREEELPRLANAHIRPFDLGQAPLLHVKLLQVEEQKHLLMFDMHHILSDGTSFTVFFNELMTLYAGKAELPEIRIHYKDYVAWKFDQIQDGHLKREEDYWINKLSGELPVLHVPTDYPRPETHQMVGTQYKFEIGEQLTQRLRQYSLQQNTTLYMTLLAAYNAFLMKYSGGQEDIIVGTWAAARTSQELERMIGLFINSIPLRNYPKPDKTYCQLLKEVKVTLLEAYDHQNYPFELLVDKLNAPQDPSRSAIYDTAFSFLNIELPDIQAEGLSITGYPFDWKVAEYDFYLAAAEGEHTLSMELAYSTLLFKEDTIVTMAGDFVAVLQQVMDDPELELGQLGLPGLQSCASTLTGLQA